MIRFLIAAGVLSQSFFCVASPRVVQVDSGHFHSCALLEDSSVWCWGSNMFGQFGIGNNKSSATAVLVIPSDHIPKPISLFTGFARTCVVFEDNNVRCWGYNTDGVLGMGSNEEYVGDEQNEKATTLPPLKLGTGVRVKKVAQGYANSCVLTLGGKIKCWGSNINGALGLGISDIYLRVGYSPDDMGDNLPYVKIGGRASDICSGNYFTCALTEENEVKCWGRADFAGVGMESGAIGIDPSQMGDGLQPVDLGTKEKIKKIECDQTTCVLFESGRLKCFGDNQSGTVGIGSVERVIGDAKNELGQNLPYVDLGAGMRVVDISVGRSHACALVESGSIKCWGQNIYGQLGIGDNTSRGIRLREMGDHLPFAMMGAFAKVSNVTARSLRSCAVLKHHGLKCWGRPLENQDKQFIGDEVSEMLNLKPILFKK